MEDGYGPDNQAVDMLCPHSQPQDDQKPGPQNLSHSIFDPSFFPGPFCFIYFSRPFIRRKLNQFSFLELASHHNIAFSNEKQNYN